TDDIPDAEGLIRYRDGRGMGRGRIPRVRIRTGAVARSCVGVIAGRLPDRRPAGRDRVRVAVRPHRLARHVHGRSGPGTAGALHPQQGTGLSGHWLLAIYAIALMTAFNFFSHGTQDLFPTLLDKQRGFSIGTVTRIAIVYNIGAICGGLFFGALSSRIGRRKAIALAAALALPALPFWGFSLAPVNIAIAAFVLQFMVQGAWGVVPVHLNELSPQGLRATFPGFVYQLGNLIASLNAPLQATIAEHHSS